MRRNDLLPKLGVTPSIGSRVSAALARAIEDAQRASPGAVTVLDAGCGRKSPLVPFRPRIARLVGVDLHEPSPPLPWLDAFATVDLCSPAMALPRDRFDLVLSNFTLEHFRNPDVALAAFFACLRPGGTLVITTVNRSHPFVAAYLEMPDRLRRRAQPVLKASAADAHPLVGACNDPTTVRDALLRAGFDDVRMEFVANLARSWHRHWWTFSLGLVGDVLTLAMPARRSTILAVAHRPSA
jgi:SAM-dependent methyltransferase